MKHSGIYKAINCFVLASILTISIACTHKTDPSKDKNDVFATEKAFEKRAAEKGIADAFAFYADDSAVILREHDTLIKGKENILKYYTAKNLSDASVRWTPDYVFVSADGTLAYTYGQYEWKTKSKDGATSIAKGVFHTVWKKQADNSWRYVWD